MSFWPMVRRLVRARPLLEPCSAAAGYRWTRGRLRWREQKLRSAERRRALVLTPRSRFARRRRPVGHVPHSQGAGQASSV